MKQELFPTNQSRPCIQAGPCIPLFAGIQLHYLSLTGESFSVHHESSDHSMVINYCKNGRIGWQTENGTYIYLGAGDFSVHTRGSSLDTQIELPNGSYEGLSIDIDVAEMTRNPPELFSGTGISGSALYEKLCRCGTLIPFTREVQTDAIFQFFYDQPPITQPVYQKLKTLELLLYLFHSQTLSPQRATKYQSEQIELIRQIHDYLSDHLGQRITIEELSKQYLMNPTTMKALFKSVYGTSIAAHMKEHRMRQAAKLLLESEMSIAEIALAVGYDSQSKFSTAFKEFFHTLPKEYRKKR